MRRDEQMRRLERQLAAGNTSVRPELTAARLRAGQLDPERVQLAAHLHDPVAEQVAPGALPRIRCTCGSLRTCSRCKGAGDYSIPTDLVPFVRVAEIPREILLAWGCDCAEHVVPLTAAGDRAPLTRVLQLARANAPELVGLADAAAEMPANHMAHRAIQLLVRAVRSQHTSPAHLRTMVAGVITCAYRAAGNTRAERDWQIAALTGRLLDDE